MDCSQQWLTRLELLQPSGSERQALRQELQAQGRQCYVRRRTLLQGQRVALLGCDGHLVRWCGGVLQRGVARADLVLLGRTAGQCPGTLEA